MKPSEEPMQPSRTPPARDSIYDPVMTARAVNVHYGDKHAVCNVSLDVGRNQVLALIGAGGQVERIYDMSSGKPSTPPSATVPARSMPGMSGEMRATRPLGVVASASL